MDTKWVHIIGVCGSATSGIAVMFKKMGWKVTGSDKGFFPPVSEFLKTHDIQILPGFKLERLHAGNGTHPDLVVIQGTKSDKNEEYQEALRLKLTVKNYAEVLVDYVIAANSIVVAGSFGKTTTTAILSHIFKCAGQPVSHMYAGLTPDFAPTVTAKDDFTSYSVVEGDEYLTSFIDKRSKFFHYHPRFLILTGLQYDHVDLFPTPESYYNNFRELLRSMPEDGLLVANIDDQNVQKVLPAARCRIITFSMQQNLKLKPDWYLMRDSKPLPCFIRNMKTPEDKLEIIPFERNILGSFNDANFLAAAVLASELGVKKEKIQKGVASFAGVQRRLQIRFRDSEQLIVDDLGSTPGKAAAALGSLREEFPHHRIMAVFEPNAGNRDAKALKLFLNCLKDADIVILPKFTMLPKTGEFRYAEEDLLELLHSNGQRVEYYPDDTDLVAALESEFASQPKLLVVFMGSHSFRGMIPELINKIKK